MVHAYQKPELLLNEIDNIRNSDDPANLKLGKIWTVMAFVRAYDLAAMMHNTIGNTVHAGPFKGMKLTPAVTTGAFGPALVGNYEHELHKIFEWVITQPFKQILNIGCAYGYYSVGLALRLPNVVVHSFDIEPKEQQRCRDMAILNNVQDRIKIAGEFRGEDFATYDPDGTLLLMDIEGGEKTLLDPTKYPNLQKMHIIAELHEVFDPGIAQEVVTRFAATHDIEIIRHNQGLLFDFEKITGPLRYVDPFDSLLMNWENRGGPTPWAIMKPKK